MAYLVDTDILIDYLRGQKDAVRFLDLNLQESEISVITIAELYQGTRDSLEKRNLTTMLSVLVSHPITQEIAEIGGIFSRDYRKTYGCGLADCLIAATCSVQQLTLATLNVKHYPMIPNIFTPYKKA